MTTAPPPTVTKSDSAATPAPAPAAPKKEEKPLVIDMADLPKDPEKAFNMLKEEVERVRKEHKQSKTELTNVKKKWLDLNGFSGPDALFEHPKDFDEGIDLARYEIAWMRATYVEDWHVINEWPPIRHTLL